MPTLLAILCLTLFSISVVAQEDTLRPLVEEGVDLHNKGDYSGAITLYNKAIGYDESYYLAHVEKATALYSASRYQEAIEECKLVLQKFKDSADNQLVYVDYGSSLDGMGDTSGAIDVYKEGMRKFPKFYVLPLNKGILEFNRGHMNDAIADLETSLWLDPVHATSHQILGDAVSAHNRVAGLLAYMTFLLIEPEGPRAEKNLRKLMNLLGSNVSRPDIGHIYIAVPEAGDENNFHTAETVIGTYIAIGVDKPQRNTPLSKSLAILFNSIDPDYKDDPGFFVRFYMPFLYRMKSHGMLEVACHVMLTSMDDDVNKDWLAGNQDKVNAFYKWFKGYRWIKEQ